MIHFGGMTPEAHGTLRALSQFRALLRFDESVAEQLERLGYAQRNKGRLLITERGDAVAGSVQRMIT